MKLIVTLFFVILAMQQPAIYNFGDTCSHCKDWFVVVDGVMGGLSHGAISHTPNSILFTGSISLENNGGFASVRTPYGQYDLSDFETITVRYKSTGQDFGLTLNAYKEFWKPKYKTNLPVTNGSWSTITCNLSDFKTYKLGEELGGNPDREDLAKIIRLGFISNTKAATDFTLEIDQISFK